jgi:hypothetical protein
MKLGRTFDFVGQRIAYGIVGNGAPLVMVHGTQQEKATCRKTARSS